MTLTELYLQVVSLVKENKFKAISTEEFSSMDEDRRSKHLAEDFLLSLFLEHNSSMPVSEIKPLIDIPTISQDKKAIKFIKGISLRKLTEIVSPEASKSSKWDFIESDTEKKILAETKKVKELKEHLTNTNAEIDHYGAVYTDYRLIDKILDKLDEVYKSENNGKSIFKNEDGTFCDPASGSGSFLICIKERLISNLKMIDGYEEEKHILNKMIFGSEIQKKQYLISKKILNYKDRKGINLNVNLGDSLGFNFWNKQFLVTIGNPPYQESMDSGERKAKNHNLWEQFVLKGLEITLPNGYLVYIMPTSWMSPAWKHMDDTFRANTLHYLEVNTIQEYFPGVGSQFCWFILQKKTPPEGFKTKIKSKFDGQNYSLEEEFNSIPFLASLLSKESVSIMKKFYNYDGTRFSMAADSNLHATGKKQYLSKEKTEQHVHPIKHTSSQMRWSTIPHRYQSSKKVLACLSGNLAPEFDDSVYGTTQAYMYSIVQSNEEGIAKEALLKSKAYQFIFKICKWSGFNIQKVFQNIPYPELESYDDQSIYSALGLTQKEIKQIEKVIK